MFLLTTLASLAFAAELSNQTAEHNSGETRIGVALVYKPAPDESDKFHDLYRGDALEEHLDRIGYSDWIVEQRNGHVLAIDPAVLPAYHRLLALQVAENLIARPAGLARASDFQGNQLEFIQDRIDAKTISRRHPDWSQDSEIQLLAVLNVIVETEFGQVRCWLAPLPVGPLQRELFPEGYGSAGGMDPRYFFVGRPTARFHPISGWGFTFRETIRSPHSRQAFEDYSALLNQTVSSMDQESDQILQNIKQPISEFTAAILQRNGIDQSEVQIGNQLPDVIKAMVREGRCRLHVRLPDSHYETYVPEYLREMVSRGVVVDAHIDCYVARPGIAHGIMDFQVPLE